MKKQILICDVCKSEKNVESRQGMQIIFTTEQNEGHNCNHYLDSNDIDLCIECRKKVIDGNYIFGKGMMGTNEYYFKN